MRATLMILLWLIWIGFFYYWGLATFVLFMGPEPQTTVELGTLMAGTTIACGLAGTGLGFLFWWYRRRKFHAGLESCSLTCPKAWVGYLGLSILMTGAWFVGFLVFHVPRYLHGSFIFPLMGSLLGLLLLILAAPRLPKTLSPSPPSPSS